MVPICFSGNVLKPFRWRALRQTRTETELRDVRLPPPLAVSLVLEA